MRFMSPPSSGAAPASRRAAGGDLVRLGVAVVGRTAHDDVVDVDVVAGEPDCLDDARQELAGLADEGLALLVLVLAGAFADEHQACLRAAHPEDDVRASL